MGVVIRPAAFAREIASSRRHPIHLKPIRALRARRFDLPFAALFVAFMALAWILALAGTAFAVRAVLVLCFATLAGRGAARRRTGDDSHLALIRVHEPSRKTSRRLI